MNSKNILIITLVMGFFFLTGCSGGGGGGGGDTTTTPNTSPTTTTTPPTTTPSQSPAGSLDTTFGTGGKVTTAIGSGDEYAYALGIQSDGKIVAAGYSVPAVGGTYDFALVRYNTDGTLDATFDGGGITATDLGGGDDYAYALAIQSDGRIVVAGQATGNDFGVVRYNADGTLDTTFGSSGGVITAVGSYADSANAVAIQSDGRIIAAGHNEVNGSLDEFALVRYTSNGTLDTTFGTNGIVTTELVNASASAMRIQSDGKIVAAGRTSAGGFYDFALVRYTSNGALDTAFGTNGKVTTPIGGYTEYADALRIQSDGKIVAAGNANTGVGVDFAIVRYWP